MMRAIYSCYCYCYLEWCLSIYIKNACKCVPCREALNVMLNTLSILDVYVYMSIIIL